MNITHIRLIMLLFKVIIWKTSFIFTLFSINCIKNIKTKFCNPYIYDSWCHHMIFLYIIFVIHLLFGTACSCIVLLQHCSNLGGRLRCPFSWLIIFVPVYQNFKKTTLLLHTDMCSLLIYNTWCYTIILFYIYPYFHISCGNLIAVYRLTRYTKLYEN